MREQSLAEYIREALAGFENDPADSDFQRGYKAALEAVKQFMEESD